VAGCSTVRYSSDFDPEIAFSEYRTYDWMVLNERERAALERINPFLERRLQRAVESELADRGFVKGDGEEVDVLVSVFPIVLERPEGYSRGRRPGSRVNVIVGFGLGRGYYPYRFPYGYPYFGYGYRGFSPYWLPFGYPYFAFWNPYFDYPRDPNRVARDGLGPGTLVVDVIDGESGELAWRGWAEGALLDTPSSEKLDEYAGEVISKILKGFPPPAEVR
jgi:hypothetical protein